METHAPKQPIFTRYQVLMIVLLSLMQFTVVLDFMVLNPLGEILLHDFTTQQFGFVVAAYPFSACISAIVAAGFADKFDRKKMLMLFYTGFILGTYFCALANDYPTLLAARIVTGLFGGVISSIGMAIIVDLFRPETRGRVMGYTQMALALSQILGVPIGWELAIRFNWHFPFWMIAAFGTLLGAAIGYYMQPITGHLGKNTEKNAFRHLSSTVKNPRYRLAFLTTVLIATGGYMLMPFGNAFSQHNMGIAKHDVTLLFMASGLANLIASPLIGRLSDKAGRANVFYAASTVTLIMVIIYTNRGLTPFYLAMLINVVMMVAVFARIIPMQATMTSLPTLQDRGSFMSVNAAVQQLSGGIAAVAASRIVHSTETGYLEHYPVLGYVIAVALTVTMIMMYFLNRQVMAEAAAVKQQPEPGKMAAAS